MGFELVKEERLDCDVAKLPSSLARLFAYWQRQRGDRPMPRRDDIDALDLRANLGRVHLLAVEGPETFRYRLYGSRVTNPDAVDMTGKTTDDYSDQAFGKLVTRHLAICVRERAPLCYAISARLDGEPYEYKRMSLPLSADGTKVSGLLVGTERGTVPDSVRRGL